VCAACEWPTHHGARPQRARTDRWSIARLLEALLDWPLIIPHPVVGPAPLLRIGRGTSTVNALLALCSDAGTLLGTGSAMLVVSASLCVSIARASFAWTA
jgi:ABC-type sulfate transport system permease component